jgi:cytochrome c oxidase assembly factor CtaG
MMILTLCYTIFLTIKPVFTREEELLMAEVFTIFIHQTLSTIRHGLLPYFYYNTKYFLLQELF